MKKLMITAAALMIAVAAHAQGSFTFNVKSAATGNDLKFFAADGVTPLGGATSDYFVQVFAGPATGGVAGLVPLTDGVLPLNRTAATAMGYPNPTIKALDVTGIVTGTSALVGYALYQGTSWAAATAKTDIFTKANGGTGADQIVALAVAPNLPSEVFLGKASVALPIPEPTTLALGLIGLGTLLVFRRRQ